MARKPKSVYERIAEVESKIKSHENAIAQLNEELAVLNTEKDNIEMQKIFEHSKQINMSYEDVIKALNMYSKGA